MIIAIIVLTGLGFAFALILTLAGSKFFVKVDPRISRILEKLPGGNCGACGFAGCAKFAQALINKEASAESCTMTEEESAKKIGEILGVEVKAKEKSIALVACAGGTRQASIKYIYDGVQDCHAAALLFGGDKACPYGCLGLETCVKACPFNAISIENGIAQVNQEKCTGCEKCVATCPRGLIKMVPFRQKVFVLCSSEEKGKKVKQACAIGCIGCGICLKACPREAITMKNNLAIIDDKKCDQCGICIEKCPQKCIIKL